jgi:hypothetical protein
MSTIMSLEHALPSLATNAGGQNLCVYRSGLHLWFSTKRHIGSRFWVWSAWRHRAPEYLSRWHGDPAGIDSMESQLFND